MSDVAARRTLPDFVARPPQGPYRSLNPTTKLVLAFAAALIAFGVRGWTGPLVVLAVVVACAVWAGVARRLGMLLLATIPIVISILLVNTFLFPGATDPIVTIGPVTATWSGLTVALQATLRVLAFAGSAALLGLTTTTGELIADLERRGVGRRPVFIIGAAIGTVPRLIDRAREITEAQRARGMDTEGRVWRRVRGVLPLAGPLVLGAITDVEQRTMALEARGFTAPGRRTVLRVFPDTSGQRALRWGVGVLAILAVAASVSGLLAWLP